MQQSFTAWGFTWNENFHLRWVPHELAPDLGRHRFEFSGRLMQILEVKERDLLRILVIEDQNWFVLEY
jgi:hypothetical protein